MSFGRLTKRPNLALPSSRITIDQGHNAFAPTTSFLTNLRTDVFNNAGTTLDALSRPGAIRNVLHVKLMLASTWQRYLNERQSGNPARFGPYGCMRWMKLICVPTERCWNKVSPTRMRRCSRMVNPTRMPCSRILNTEHLAQSRVQVTHASQCRLVKLGPFAGANDVRQLFTAPVLLDKTGERHAGYWHGRCTGIEPFPARDKHFFLLNLIGRHGTTQR
jgi:hypothetical protein